MIAESVHTAISAFLFLKALYSELLARYSMSHDIPQAAVETYGAERFTPCTSVHSNATMSATASKKAGHAHGTLALLGLKLSADEVECGAGVERKAGAGAGSMIETGLVCGKGSSCGDGFGAGAGVDVIGSHMDHHWFSFMQMKPSTQQVDPA